MRLELVTAPTIEPLTLAEAKVHLRVTGTDEDALITRLISAARRQIEAIIRRKLITQHWRVYFDAFPGQCWVSSRYRNVRADGFVLPDVAPVSAVDSVKYIDADGVLQTLATSVYQLVAETPARVVLAYNQVWPEARGDADGVRIEVTSGYGAAGSDVPSDILAAMLLLVGHWFENREASAVVAARTMQEIPLGVETLLSPYIVPEF